MKIQVRTAVLSCCITLLLLGLTAFSSVAFYNTASVLNSTDEVVSVQKEEKEVFFVWMGNKYRLPLEEIESAVSRLEGWAPLFPKGVRYAAGLARASGYGVDHLLDFLQDIWTFS